MFNLKLLIWIIFLVIWNIFAGNTQDYTHMWNASKRVALGLDRPTGVGVVHEVLPEMQGISGIADVRVFASPNPQDENSIAISPANPAHLFISTNGRHPETNPSIHQTWFFSNDGGNSWFGSEDIPYEIVDCHGDPVAFFDVNGKAYYTILGNPGGIYLVSTTDLGQQWSARMNADTLNSTGDDKEHAAADLSGVYPDNVYAAWTDFNVAGAPVIISRSINNGATWRDRTNLAIGSNRGQGVHITTGPNGEVYVMWAHYTAGTAEAGIGFAKSTNGGDSYSTPAVVFPINGIRIYPDRDGIPELNNTRAASFPYCDVDRSNGERRGWVYVVTPELVTNQAEIFLRYSSNGGSTWSNPIQVNGPDVEPGKWQWMPSLAVDPTNGDIAITYFSMDSTGSNFMTNRYLAYSSDGGITFKRVVISDVRFNWEPRGDGKSSPTYAGDYYETAAYGGKVWNTWSDKRTGVMQAWVENLPGPPVYVTVDQKLEGSPGSIDNVGRWEADMFKNYPVPQTFTFIANQDEVLRGAQNIISNQKYIRWNELEDVTNHHSFDIEPNMDDLTSNFEQTKNGITIRNEFLSAPGADPEDDVIEFKDPWFIDYPDPDYNDQKRNRGMKDHGPDALHFWERSSPFYPDYDTEYNGNKYLGVFLDQLVIPGMSYYSVQTLQMQPINFHQQEIDFYFQGWDGVEVDIINPDLNQTAVVFRDYNPQLQPEVIAKYKGHLASSATRATASNNGRRLIRDNGGKWHLVYQDHGHIYYTYSTNDGASWEPELRLSQGDNINSHPTICIGDIQSETEVINVVWNAGCGESHHICWRRQWSGGQWSDIYTTYNNWIEGAIQNTTPVAIGGNPFNIFCIHKTEENTFLELYRFEDEDLELLGFLESENGTPRNPAIGQSPQSSLIIHVAWEDRNQIYYSYFMEGSFAEIEEVTLPEAGIEINTQSVRQG